MGKEMKNFKCVKCKSERADLDSGKVIDQIDNQKIPSARIYQCRHCGHDHFSIDNQNFFGAIDELLEWYKNSLK